MTIAWTDGEKRNNVMWKVPRNIRFNDNIVVREDEIAVFYRDGKALDYIDRPDRYALTSMNAPIVGNIAKWLSGAQQQAEVYYIQKKVFDGKFGSKQPYVFEDKTFQLIKLSLFGEFRYKVSNPTSFINYFVGTLNISTAADVEDRIKEQVVTSMYNVLGKLKDKSLGVINLAANLKNIEQIFLEDSKTDFEPYGITIDKISGLYISLPDEVQKAVDTRASMSVLGTNYMGYQTGQAMREAASNPSGGTAGVGVGVGAGVGMGYAMMGQMVSGSQQHPSAFSVPTTPTSPPPGSIPCTKCGATVPSGSKFCPSCGTPQQNSCPKCGVSLPSGAKFCPSCGASIQGSCSKCGAKLESGVRFCSQCGNPSG
ncbi:MAG TPA: SPFH domain-containing protein [Methanocella sp.]|nr:SPFH domain-containing protein [Methanocella sp.]